MIEPLDALKDKMVMVAKILQHQGVIDGYGHITARLPENRILSTPHMPPGKVAVRDLIILDADGKKLEGFGAPNGETAMHTSIYKARPDVQCILHYHADELVAVAATGQEIKVISNCGVNFHRGTPIYDSPVLIRNAQLGDKVAATLSDKTAVLLRGHGGTVVAQQPRPALPSRSRSRARRENSDHGRTARSSKGPFQRRMRGDGTGSRPGPTSIGALSTITFPRLSIDFFHNVDPESRTHG